VEDLNYAFEYQDTYCKEKDNMSRFHDGDGNSNFFMLVVFMGLLMVILF